MRTRSRVAAGLSGVLLALLAVTTVAAYETQVDAAVSISIKGTVTCGASPTATATILDANGAPVAGESVAWSFVTSPSNADRLSPTPTLTNSKGQATTTLTLASVGGTRRIRATAGDVSATVVLNPSCGGSLPSTSTLPAGPSSGPGLAPSILFALAFAAGCALMLRRLVPARR